MAYATAVAHLFVATEVANPKHKVHALHRGAIDTGSEGGWVVVTACHRATAFHWVDSDIEPAGPHQITCLSCARVIRAVADLAIESAHKLRTLVDPVVMVRA